jgi:hypothetical protein
MGKVWLVIAVTAAEIFGTLWWMAEHPQQREVRQRDVPVYVEDRRVNTCDVVWTQQFRLENCQQEVKVGR